MKKLFIVLVLLFSTYWYVNAESFSGDFCYNEDGKTEVQIHLNLDGSYWMKDYSEGDFYSGNYKIYGKLVPGNHLSIEFSVDGEIYRGNIMWGTQDKPTIIFSGLVFVYGRPKR